MFTKLLKEELTYDGLQLSSAFFAERKAAAGDAVLVFIGPADVPTENLVDEEDRRAGETIESRRMVHVLVRLPGRSLETGVLWQRLLICLILETLRGFGVALDGTPMLPGSAALLREGDDIFRLEKAGKRKLSVSIAATDAQAALIHVGINATGEGAPVPAIGVEDLGLEAHAFAAELLSRIDHEYRGINRAKSKVRMLG